MNDEDRFKEAYRAAFLGSYAALHYDRNCQMGWTTSGDQPIEDADHLATEAWKKIRYLES